jgi:hypothetical protein
MAGKIFLKRAAVIFFSCWIFLILCSCMSPVDIQAFLQDENVQEIIKETQKPPPVVIVHEDSDNFAGLRGESEKISGLTAGKYYRVEEYDEEKVFKRNLFIKTDGGHYGDLSEIGPLEGGQILGLINNYTYKVKFAQPFNNGTYKYFAFAGTAEDAAVTSGAVTIIVKDSRNYYLDLAPVINANKNYEVMDIQKTGTWGDYSRTSANYNGPPGSIIGIGTMYQPHFNTKQVGIYQFRTAVSTSPGGVSLQNRSIIALPGESTQSDYVFAEYDNGSVTNFIVLSVEKINPTDVNVTVAVSYTSANSPQVNVTQTPISQTSNSQITVRVTNTIYSSYQWYVDGIIKTGETKATYTFNMSDVSNKMVGVYIITVEGTIGSIPYSTDVKITVVP